MDNREIIKECSFIIPGLPKTKSNFNLVNKTGKKILPANSPYAAYENKIIESISKYVGNKKFEYKTICIIKVYFKHKRRHPDLNNMTKSICDGIEKSGLIDNDKDVLNILLDEQYDYDNPRVEVEMYDFRYFKPVFKVIPRDSAEIAELEEEFLEQTIATQKRKTRRERAKSKKIICDKCNNPTDKEHSSQIPGTKKFICNRCYILNN
ncbi:RusA family crossover junction endodeoxyribonuclease [Clostridium perfringens]